jgi:hypothetical protein
MRESKAFFFNLAHRCLALSLLSPQPDSEQQAFGAVPTINFANTIQSGVI